MEPDTYAHGKGQLDVHLVFAPKYRHPVLARDEIRTYAEQTLRWIADEQGYEIHALELQRDHVHIFVGLPPDVSPSKAVQMLKGRSSYELFRAFPILRDVYPRGSLWSAGKFYRSVGAVTDKTVRRYILEQTKDPGRYAYSFMDTSQRKGEQRSLLEYGQP